jgi:ATP/maltotriose-dependent transcriptional regulator MalT
MKLLEESEARVILLLAPAGYGKTTLARQWARTLTRSFWIALTPAHRDVAVLSESVATGIDGIRGDASSFVKEYLAGQSNPQRAHRRMAEALSQRLQSARADWVVFDDYQELIGSPEAEEFVSTLIDGTSARYVISSRQRPTWARSRRVVYGEMAEVGREFLAMNDDEAVELLGDGSARRALARQAQGWPAVLALAAAVEHASPPSEALPSALHRFFAEELFQRAPRAVQEDLLQFALVPSLARTPNAATETTMALTTELGFISDDEPYELHPLLREFLLEKLLDAPDREQRVRHAIDYCVNIGAWDGAIDLLRRFRSDDLVEPVLRRAFKPLVLSGRLGTLSSFAAAYRVAPSFPPPSIDIIEAEAALRDGNYELAAQLAERVRSSLDVDHPLRSRAAAIDGHSNVQLARFDEADKAFNDSLNDASDELDETEALHGLALARMLGEFGEVETVIAQLWQQRHRSPTHLLRATTTEITRRRLEEGLALRLQLEEPLMASDQVLDPRARTSFTYGAAYALAQQGLYREASTWLRRVWKDIEEFDLEFARPHALWVSALVQLGLRRFGQVEHLLQTLEDTATEKADLMLALNARSLRARLLVQTGQASDAVSLTARDCPTQVCPSWEGEYLATRAIALAASDQVAEAKQAIAAATARSRMSEVRGLVAAAESIIASKTEDEDNLDVVMRTAESLGVWDPALSAIRGCLALADSLVSDQRWRERLERLYEASNDQGLARRAGFRTRSNRSPEDLLTPRELEVLNLIARGLKNSEIAKALFISPSTTKVHVRHILEKLGVRTRAEAVLRLQMFS